MAGRTGLEPGDPEDEIPESCTLRAGDPAHAESLLHMNEVLEGLAQTALAKALGRRPSPGI